MTRHYSVVHRWPYGVEIKPSMFGGGFDVFRYFPPQENDPAEKTLLETKGTLAEAQKEAREEFERMHLAWRQTERGNPPLSKTNILY